MAQERWQRIPAGTRDWLALETSRAHAVAAGVLGAMRRWGYREVITPTLEYLEVLVRGEGAGAADRLFKIIDRGGEILALRPEMTTPVARLVTTRLRHAPLPLRLSYAGQVFRGRETGSGRLRVGCELIGSSTLDADAEIVALAAEALAATGAPDGSLSLGHVGYLRGIMAGFDLSNEDAAGVQSLLYQKDFVGLRALLERHGIPSDRMAALMSLPTLRGEGALDEAQRMASTPEGRRAVEELRGLTGMLRAYGVGESVTVDLSIIRDFEYYTGIVFEGHTAALGVPLLGGGRYDRLLERFGWPLPATGFAVRIERVLAADADHESEWEPDVMLVHDAGCRDAALRCAQGLRAAGLVVTVDVLGRSWGEVAADASHLRAGRAVLVRGDSALVRGADGREHEVALDALLRPDPAAWSVP
jgi:ATP phosphoribosyltransferase regulatory subunit